MARNSLAMLTAEVEERRSSPRIDHPFTARVSGVDTEGRAFTAHAVLDNLSADGLYVRLRQRVAEGSKLSFLIWFSDVPTHKLPSPRLEVEGFVTRMDPAPGGIYGVAVSLSRYRFL
jgi:hypothetical protein